MVEILSILLQVAMEQKNPTEVKVGNNFNLMIDDEYILEWIKFVSKHQPDLKGFSVCPFAQSATYKIVKMSIHNIKPLSEEYDVVIFIVEDDLEHQFIINKCSELSKTYSEYSFFEDCKENSTFIDNIQTNNQRYNLILYQNKRKLTEFRKKLAKTSYYDFWSDNYLKKILDYDYEIVQKIRNK